MRRYGIVLALALMGVLAVSALLRMPRIAPVPEAGPAIPAPLALSVDVHADRVTTTPESLSVGRTVGLAIQNFTAGPVRVALSGYEDRVSTPALLPGGIWRTVFLADRPGEQLAWLVNGEPRGRLDILGSHLVEGHR